MFRKTVLKSSPRVDLALLLIRVGIGLSMLGFHGYDKLMGGPETWRMIGTNMETLGITFAPVLWGFLAAFAEFAGSILLVLGALFRPAALMLAFTMFVAVLRHLSIPAGEPGAGWMGASHALELLVIYAALFLSGPGRYAFAVLPEKEAEKRK